MSSIRLRTPMPQIHGNGQTSPWSNMDVFVASSENFNHGFLLPNDCDLRPPLLRLPNPSPPYSAVYVSGLPVHLLQSTQPTQPQFFCLCACISSFFIMLVLTRSIPQLCRLGKIASHHEKWARVERPLWTLRWSGQFQTWPTRNQP